MKITSPKESLVANETLFLKIYDEMGGPDDEEEDHKIARTWLAHKKVTILLPILLPISWLCC